MFFQCTQQGCYGFGPSGDEMERGVISVSSNENNLCRIDEYHSCHAPENKYFIIIKKCGNRVQGIPPSIIIVPVKCRHQALGVNGFEEVIEGGIVKCLDGIFVMSRGKNNMRIYLLSFPQIIEDIKTLSLIHISEPTRRTPISYAV